MTDTDTIANVTPLPLRPCPPGEGPIAGIAELRPRVVKDRTATERKRRSRANKRNTSRKPQHRDTAVTTPGHGVTVPVTAPVTGKARIDMAAYTAAIALASVAALFSVKGMAQPFPGAPLLIIAMSSTMEAAKLVTAGWLARYWRATAWLSRTVLVALVAGLAVINAAGVYAQLVAAHVGSRGEAAAVLETQDAALAARIEVAAHTVADLDRRLGQIDQAVEEAAKRGKTTTALSAMEAQRRSRAGLASERNEAAGTLAALKAERASLAAQGRRIETEVAPIRYVAELLGSDTDSERAIRWLIALMVLCCDPLAIALTAAASAGRSGA